MFQTEKEVKAAVSTLRRELADLGLPRGKLSHSQGLELFAKMAKKGSYAELLAQLNNASDTVPAGKVLIDADLLSTLLDGALEHATDQRDVVAENAFGDCTEEDSEAANALVNHMLNVAADLRPVIEAAKVAGTTVTAPKAPAEAPSPRLRNEGQFDLATKGKLVDGSDFCPIDGSVENIYNCLAGIDDVSRNGGRLTLNYDGETDVNWDEQKTAKNDRGLSLYQDENGNTVPEDALIVVPEGFDPMDPDLPVREALVDAYVAFLAVHPMELDDAVNVLGFELTAVEEKALKARQH